MRGGVPPLAGTHTIDAWTGPEPTRTVFAFEDALRRCGSKIDRSPTHFASRETLEPTWNCTSSRVPCWKARSASRSRARNQMRRAACDHVPWAGGALRLHTNESAARRLGGPPTKLALEIRTIARSILTQCVPWAASKHLGIVTGRGRTLRSHAGSARSRRHCLAGMYSEARQHSERFAQRRALHSGSGRASGYRTVPFHPAPG